MPKQNRNHTRMKRFRILGICQRFNTYSAIRMLLIMRPGELDVSSSENKNNQVDQTQQLVRGKYVVTTS